MSSASKQITATDSHTLNACIAKPEAQPLGAVVVVQEIFGINAHIRNVADRLAAAGFLAVAPALFDRVERGVELKYEGEDMKRAVQLMQQLKPETALLDIAAAFAEAHSALDASSPGQPDQRQAAGKQVGVVGFCYGGFMAWLTATRGRELGIEPGACVCFYPGGIGAVASEQPSCPVMIHIGGADAHIGKEQIEAVRTAHPEIEIFTYEGAEHGFNCDARSSFNPEAAALARERTLSFLKTHLA